MVAREFRSSFAMVKIVAKMTIATRPPDTVAVRQSPEAHLWTGGFCDVHAFLDVVNNTLRACLPHPTNLIVLRCRFHRELSLTRTILGMRLVLLFI